MMASRVAVAAPPSGTECALSAQEGLFAGYELGAAHDEMFCVGAGGAPTARPHYQPLHNRLRQTSLDDFRRRKAMTDLSMQQDGVGFTVYRAEEGIERVWPMDPVPRIIPAAEWRQIEAGLIQRINALNLFLWDVYHEQHILRDSVVPARLVLQGGFFRREFVGVNVPRRIYIHICGTDLIRAADGEYLVLEDNARTPSGVSYMLQNRQVIKRVFPSLFNDYDVLLVANSMDPACRIDDEAEVVRTYTRQARMPFNLTGHPALALMTGFSSGGLPLSMQLVGKSFNEKMVLRVAAAYEQAAQWHAKHPTL